MDILTLCGLCLAYILMWLYLYIEDDLHYIIDFILPQHKIPFFGKGIGNTITVTLWSILPIFNLWLCIWIVLIMFINFLMEEGKSIKENINKKITYIKESKVISFLKKFLYIKII